MPAPAEPTRSIFRRGYEVYLVTTWPPVPRVETVILTVFGASEYELANLDKLIDLANLTAEGAQPAFMFFPAVRK